MAEATVEVANQISSTETAAMEATAEEIRSSTEALTTTGAPPSLGAITETTTGATGTAETTTGTEVAVSFREAVQDTQEATGPGSG